MNWEIIASMGEWVGAGVVALTLIYLSIQIRQQNRISQYEAWASIIEGINQQLIGSTADTVMAYLKGRDHPEECSPSELATFQTGFRIYFNNTQKAFRAYKYGFLQEEDWLVFARTFSAELGTPGGKIWRNGNESTAPSLFAEVDATGESIVAELDLMRQAKTS